MFTHVLGIFRSYGRPGTGASGNREFRQRVWDLRHGSVREQGVWAKGMGLASRERPGTGSLGKGYGTCVTGESGNREFEQRVRTFGGSERSGDQWETPWGSYFERILS